MRKFLPGAAIRDSVSGILTPPGPFVALERLSAPRTCETACSRGPAGCARCRRPWHRRAERLAVVAHSTTHHASLRVRGILGHHLQHGRNPPVWSRLSVYKTGPFERVNGVRSICVGTVSRNLSVVLFGSLRRCV